jgi:hypothetical protein
MDQDCGYSRRVLYIFTHLVYTLPTTLNINVRQAHVKPKEIAHYVEQKAM